MGLLTHFEKEEWCTCIDIDEDKPTCHKHLHYGTEIIHHVHSKKHYGTIVLGGGVVENAFQFTLDSGTYINFEIDEWLKPIGKVSKDPEFGFSFWIKGNKDGVIFCLEEIEVDLLERVAPKNCMHPLLYSMNGHLVAVTHEWGMVHIKDRTIIDHTWHHIV